MQRERRAGGIRNVRLRRLSAALAVSALALGMAVPAAQATDLVFVDGLVSTAGVNGPAVNLTELDVRSLDGHSSCLHAFSSVDGWTAGLCTNDLLQKAYAGTFRTPQVYSGWAGNNVDMRGREYY